MNRGDFEKFPNPDREGPFVHTIREYSAEKDQPAFSIQENKSLFLFRKDGLGRMPHSLLGFLRQRT